MHTTIITAIKFKRHFELKECLVSYKKVTQHQNSDSLQYIMKTYIKTVEGMWQTNVCENYSDEKIIKVLNKYDSTNLYANFFSAKKKKDDQIIRENWKFIYEGYKNILENCKYNFKLEQLYIEVAKLTFRLCQRFGQVKCFKNIASLISYSLKNTIKWMDNESNTLNMKI